MNNQYKQGMLSVIACGLWWGVMPVYWKVLQPIDSVVIIFYRIVLVAVFCFLYALKVHGLDEIRQRIKPNNVKLRYFAAGILITFNWSIYIWAVNAGKIVEACIGYYIQPLVVCLFSVLLFKEKMDKLKTVATVFAFTGVSIIIVHFGKVPMVALSLAVTFAIYAAIKKGFAMPPMLSLFYETFFLVPPAFAVVIWLEATGRGALATMESPIQYGLLMFSGILTAVPLALFANAANKVDLFSVGLSSYIGPTISLIISIFMFKEPFDKVQLIAFAVIWTGLILFSSGEYRNMKRASLKKEENLVE